MNHSHNLYAGERRSADLWYHHVLRPHQRERVSMALDIMDGLELVVDGQRIFLTTIVAGSSVFPPDRESVRGELPTKPISLGKAVLHNIDEAKIQEIMGKYKGIDLFVLLENYWELFGERGSEQDPRAEFEKLLARQGGQRVAPAHTYYLKTGEARIRAFDLNMARADSAYQRDRRLSIQHTPSATHTPSGPLYVTVSLLEDTFCRPRRECHQDDLVSPPGYGQYPPAEPFIAYNNGTDFGQQKGVNPRSRFLVLNRQKTLPEK